MLVGAAMAGLVASALLFSPAVTHMTLAASDGLDAWQDEVARQETERARAQERIEALLAQPDARARLGELVAGMDGAGLEALLNDSRDAMIPMLRAIALDETEVDGVRRAAMLSVRELQESEARALAHARLDDPVLRSTAADILKQ
jgi:hypothetical protein